MSNLIAVTSVQPNPAEKASDVLSLAAALVSGFVLLLEFAVAF